MNLHNTWVSLSDIELNSLQIPVFTSTSFNFYTVNLFYFGLLRSMGHILFIHITRYWYFHEIKCDTVSKLLKIRHSQFLLKNILLLIIIIILIMIIYIFYYWFALVLDCKSCLFGQIESNWAVWASRENEFQPNKSLWWSILNSAEHI